MVVEAVIEEAVEVSHEEVVTVVEEVLTAL